MIVRVQPQANAGAAGGQLQRLAHQRQGDFRLPGSSWRMTLAAMAPASFTALASQCESHACLACSRSAAACRKADSAGAACRGHHLFDFAPCPPAGLPRPLVGGWRRLVLGLGDDSAPIAFAPGPGIGWPGPKRSSKLNATACGSWGASAARIIVAIGERLGGAITRPGPSFAAGRSEIRCANAAICRRASSMSLRRMGPGWSKL